MTLCAISQVLLAAAFAADTAAVKEFDERVAAYMKVRKTAASGIPALKPKSTAEQIYARKVALSEAIRAARSDARQGDIFTPGTRGYILQVIRSETKGKEGTPAKEAARQGNPATEGTPVPLKVNAQYPENAPLSTVPATLLMRLPGLPKELDYRFVGRTLILRDTEAGLILDFILNAMP